MEILWFWWVFEFFELIQLLYNSKARELWEKNRNINSVEQEKKTVERNAKKEYNSKNIQ